jgi:hypothetical protein
MDPGWKVEHVGSPRRAEVLLPDLKIATGIIFEVRMIASKAVIAHLVGGRVEVGNENAGVVPAPAADHLAAGERVDPPDSRATGCFPNRSKAPPARRDPWE